MVNAALTAFDSGPLACDSLKRTCADSRRGSFARLAKALGFEARTGGDPRGACAYLIDPANRKGDGWGEGWAVYE